MLKVANVSVALSSQTVQKSFIVAAQLDVFEPQTVQQALSARFNTWSLSL
jgi:hypothetical protein